MEEEVVVEVVVEGAAAAAAVGAQGIAGVVEVARELGESTSVDSKEKTHKTNKLRQLFKQRWGHIPQWLWNPADVWRWLLLRRRCHCPLYIRGKIAFGGNTLSFASGYRPSLLPGPLVVWGICLPLQLSLPLYERYLAQKRVTTCELHLPAVFGMWL